MRFLALTLILLSVVTLAFAEPKEANFAAITTILPTALPTAYSTPQFNNTATKRHVWIRNSTNEEVWCAVNGSTSTSIVIPAGSTWWDSLGARDQKLSGGIGCIHPSSTPASGNVIIGGNN